MKDERVMKITTDIGYSTDLALDLYEPSTSAPGLMLLHGGGWFEGDKQKDRELASALCEAGFFVWEPNYHLAPHYPYTVALDDLEHAVLTMLDSEYTFDRSKIAVMGTSAGGHLAIEFALRKDIPCVSWSGPTDLEAIYEQSSPEIREQAFAVYQTRVSQHQPDSGALPNQQGVDDTKLLAAVFTVVNGDISQLASSSPVNHVLTGAPPTYLANSLHEFIPVEQAVKMQQALTAVGTESVLHLVPGTAHAKGITRQTLPGTLAFLKRWLT